jgi:hypothetical protein
MFLTADQGMLAVWAEPPIGSGLASAAGEAVVAAGSAVFGRPGDWTSSERGPSRRIAAGSDNIRTIVQIAC